ncbi:hypothetical protein OPV22_026452 [Ensete ventricosum]|uniref:Non-structural maintenance of chromosomes element 4 n=1 Tax=Ensete ventricosum TaxID=4639 RepID=A0AAV8Q6I4_ENSVE|nr:hypothetical protein OPV22_026452 [Ensete ventricosum]
MAMAAVKTGEPSGTHGGAVQRSLRSSYLAVKNLISDDKDDTGSADSDKFTSIFTHVENLHELVQRPREQVTDAEALLDITNSLLVLVKSHSNDVISPSEFVNGLLRNSGQKERDPNINNSYNMICWNDVGLAVSHVFRKVPEFHTMIGPMDITLKQRKAAVNRKRKKPTEVTCPEELSQADTDGKNDTDKNMSTMFNILRKMRHVRFESLVLNRTSFAQTVENVFALSFLVKGGRAEITVGDDGQHLVSPRNSPVGIPGSSRDVADHHFVFRFDCKDWKQMVVVIQDNVFFSVFIMLYFMCSYFHTLLVELKAVKNTSEFIIVIGLAPGSALNPYLFVLLIDMG